ncbi:MAG: hypothetical protein MJ025_07045, partial [Victivallaceae bacterium]|nr:hypothetical protein [Victivallaceae bacterium]
MSFKKSLFAATIALGVSCSLFAAAPTEKKLLPGGFKPGADGAPAAGWHVVSGEGTAQVVKAWGESSLKVKTPAGDNVYWIATEDFEIVPGDKIPVTIRYAGKGSVALTIEYLNGKKERLQISRNHPLKMSADATKIMQETIASSAPDSSVKYVRIGLKFTSTTDVRIASLKAKLESRANEQVRQERADARDAKAANEKPAPTASKQIEAGKFYSFAELGEEEHFAVVFKDGPNQVITFMVEEPNSKNLWVKKSAPKNSRL